MELSQANREILSAVIRAYVLTGEPVGSKVLRELAGLHCSPATIRAKMSELCELGFLSQPHTSAGRVPTALGYRFYVEQLMDRYKLSQADKNEIDSLLPSPDTTPEKLIDCACEALAELTNCAAMLTTPADAQAQIAKVQFIPIGRRTVMVVLITSAGMIKNRVARCDFDMHPQTLLKMNRLVEQTVCGKTLEEFTSADAQALLVASGVNVFSAAPLIAALVDTVGDAVDAELRLKGTSNLLTHREFSAQKARELLDYLQNKGKLLTILRHEDKDFEILLGSETGEEALSSSGVIVTRYSVGGREVGSIGILGPARMDYEHIIPSILYFRDSLGRLLTESYAEDI